MLLSVEPNKEDFERPGWQLWKMTALRNTLLTAGTLDHCNTQYIFKQFFTWAHGANLILSCILTEVWHGWPVTNLAREWLDSCWNQTDSIHPHSTVTVTLGRRFKENRWLGRFSVSLGCVKTCVCVDHRKVSTPDWLRVVWIILTWYTAVQDGRRAPHCKQTRLWHQGSYSRDLWILPEFCQRNIL